MIPMTVEMFDRKIGTKTDAPVSTVVLIAVMVILEVRFIFWFAFNLRNFEYNNNLTNLSVYT